MTVQKTGRFVHYLPNCCYPSTYMVQKKKSWDTIHDDRLYSMCSPGFLDVPFITSYYLFVSSVSVSFPPPPQPWLSCELVLLLAFCPLAAPQGIYLISYRLSVSHCKLKCKSPLIQFAIKTGCGGQLEYSQLNPNVAWHSFPMTALGSKWHEIEIFFDQQLWLFVSRVLHSSTFPLLSMTSSWCLIQRN